MISLIDESVVEHPTGFVYVIASVVLDSDMNEIRETLRHQVLLNGRVRPSHWSEEGPRVRTFLCELCETISTVGQTFVSPCGRKGQESTRVRLLEESLTWAHTEGSSEVFIESRGETLDKRDRRTVKNYSSTRNITLRVQWRTKNEPLLWLADSLAGATRENLMSPVSSPLADRLLIALRAEKPHWA